MTNHPLFTKLILVPLLLPALAWLEFTAEDTSGQNIPGAYSAAALTEDIKTAADFAVQEQSKREAIVLKRDDISKVEKQIVAHVSYRLDIVVEQSGSARMQELSYSEI